MANWLEEEEQRRARRAAADADEYRRRHELNQQRALMDGAIALRLDTFHALCNRVNAVRAGSLSINRLEVMSGRLDDRLANDEPPERIAGHRRGIRFSCGAENEAPFSGCVVISVIIRTRHHLWSAADGDRYYETDETVLVRKKCTYSDLVNWRHDQILAILKWLILESDQIIAELVPGSAFVTIAEAEAKTHCYIRFRLAKADFRGPGYIDDRVRVVIDGQVMGNLPKPRGSYIDLDSAYQVWSQFRTERGAHELRLYYGDRASSFNVRIAAGEIIDYEVHESVWPWNGGIRLRHIRTSHS